ncbi:MAG: hypothetical protein JXB49_26130, partial [Bacteroidales bacterium]|nr:hypothetical protein [Bacteroidales bacterium]
TFYFSTPQLADNASLDQQRSYLKTKAKIYKRRSGLLTKVIECFDKYTNDSEIQACVKSKIKEELK